MNISKVWFFVHRETLLPRALEGVVGAAAAYLSQKHHLRGAGNTSWRSGGFPGPPWKKFGFSKKVFLNI